MPTTIADNSVDADNSDSSNSDTMKNQGHNTNVIFTHGRRLLNVIDS